MSPEQAIKDYMPIVRKETKRWLPVFKNIYNKEDLLSYGMETLWKCSEPGKYDINSGVTFGQYAKKAIKNTFGQLLISAKRWDRLEHTTVSTTVDGDHGGDEIMDLESIARNPIHNLDLYRSIDRLSDNEKTVIKKRFFEGYDGTEIGAMLGLSRERIRQIQDSAVSNLNRRLNG